MTNDPFQQGGPLQGVARNVRFLSSLVPAMVMLLGWIALVAFINSRIPGGIGLILALIGGSSLPLGLLLVYRNAVDWSNLAIIRRTLVHGEPHLQDGEVTAFEGVVRSDDATMSAPFTATPCTAYRYRVIATGRNHTIALAEGFHMLRCRIESESRALALRGFPDVESEMHESLKGEDHEKAVQNLFARLASNEKAPGERERHATLLEAREAEIEEVHRDYRMSTFNGDATGLTLVEEVVPAGCRVCAVGTYDANLDALTARRPRLGPNLIVYRGSAREILKRVRKDTALFKKIAAYLVGLGALILGLALLPPAWTSKIPLFGWSTDHKENERAPIGEHNVPFTPQRQEHIAAQVRERHESGDRTGALELAVTSNTVEALSWLIDQGVAPDTPIPTEGRGFKLPLIEAARLGHLETARLLLEAGADPNKPQQEVAGTELTALNAALDFNHCELAGVLLAFDAIFSEGMANYRCPRP